MPMYKPNFKLFFVVFAISIAMHLLGFVSWHFLFYNPNTLTHYDSSKTNYSLENVTLSWPRVSDDQKIKTKDSKENSTTIGQDSVSTLSGSKNAKLLGVIRPEYPRLSRERNEQGVVFLQFTVQKNGAVSDPKIIESSGYPRLDQAALHAVSQARFEPAQVNGNQEDSFTELKIRFQLESK